MVNDKDKNGFPRRRATAPTTIQRNKRVPASHTPPPKQVTVKPKVAKAKAKPKRAKFVPKRDKLVTPRTTVVASTPSTPLRDREPALTNAERFRAAGARNKAARVAANAPPEPLANNTFTQTDAHSRRRVADTQNQSSGINIGQGTPGLGGAFRPRDTALGRRALGLPSRAEQNAQRVRSTGTRGRQLSFGQSMANMPAVNAAKMAAGDLRRGFANQRRRNNSTGSAAVLRANTALTTSQMDNMTNRRGQDIGATTTRRGQDVTARGQDISAATQYRGQDITARGQDVTARGQDLNYDSALRGHDVTRRGQNLDFDTTRRTQDVTMRGQDSLANTSRQNTTDRESGATLRNRETNQTRRDLGEISAGASAYSAELRQNTETRADSDRQLEGFATYDGEHNTQLSSRYKSVRDDLLQNDFNVTNMQQVTQVSNLFDEFNEAQGGDSKNFITAANFTQPENKAKLIRLGFWDALMSFDLFSRDQFDVPGAGMIPQDEIDQRLDYGTTERLGLRGRR